MLLRQLKNLWPRFWMRYAGRGAGGKMATRLAALAVPAYKGRRQLSLMHRRGYVSPDATILHDDLRLGGNVFIGDGVIIYRAAGGGTVEIGDGAALHNDIIIEVGQGGGLVIGGGTQIQPRCQFSAYKGSIAIGSDVQIGPGCSFYPYNHGIEAGFRIMRQPLYSEGNIVIEDDAWLGVGVIVLDNVRIGRGAVIGAGAVVTRDVPENAIAVGSPARVTGTRDAAGTAVRACSKQP